MMKTPIIATAHGGSLETVKDEETGWLVPPDDASAMAHTLQDALTNRKNLAKMGELGRKWVLSHFTTETMCAAEFSAYEKILSVPPTHNKE